MAARFSPRGYFAEPSSKVESAAHASTGLPAAVLGKHDPEAIIAVFTEGHLISGTGTFMSAICEVVSTAPCRDLITIGIASSYFRWNLSIGGELNMWFVSIFN